MRKVREVLRLKFDGGQTNRRIARSCQISRPTVSDYLLRFEKAGLQWPAAATLDDTALERTLFPPASAAPTAGRTVPDWSQVHRELRRKSVTLTLLWHEYKAAHPEGFQYSWFCDQYRAWTRKLDVVMRQEHRAGEKLFVDYAGQTAEVVDRRTGEIRQAQIFVAVLGASSYTYAEATWTQQLPDWIGSHVRALQFLGGVSELLVPDNLRSGVSKAHRYEPDLNPTDADLASHYGVAVLPARARKPRDKAKAETGVLLVERWILAALRHRTFFSLQVRISANVTARSGDRDRCAHRGGAGVDYSDRAVMISQLGVGLSHRFSSQWQAVGVVQKAVEDGIGQGRLADEIVPVLDGQLAGDQGGSQAMAVLDDFHQIVALGGGDFLDSPVIEDDQVGFRQLIHQLRVAAIAVGDAQRLQQTGQAEVAH